MAGYLVGLDINDVASETFSGNASTTAFTLAAAGTTNSTGVFILGVHQVPTTDYSVSGTTLTFTAAPPTGTNNISVVYTKPAIVNTPADGTITTAKLSGDLTLPGKLTAAGDTAAGDNASIGYTSAEGLILTGQGSTNDVTIKNDADADVIKIPTGTTNVTIVGDLTVSGDDLFMATNTSGAALIADGTNFNPVVISGDIAINTSGVAAIGSGVIVAGDIADDAVTLAKMASGTDGNIISFDASGNPVAIATGSDGQVLTSAGAGQPPAFEAAGGGGGSMTFLQSVDGAGQSTIDLTTGISASTYDGYLIIFNITASLDSRQLYFRTSADGGSSFDSGASDYNWFVNTIDTAPSNTVAFDQSDDEIQINGSRDIGYTGEERIYGHMMIVAPGLVERTTITGQGFYLDQNGNGNYFAFGGQRKTAAAVDGYQFLFSTGNIADGTVTMYGLKSS